MHRDVRPDAGARGEGSGVELRGRQLDEGAGSPLRQRPDVVGAFSPHDRAQRRIDDGRRLVREPPRDPHARAFAGEGKGFARGVFLLRLHARRGVVGEGAGFDSPFEFARGALLGVGDQLVLNAVLSQFLFQGGGGKHSADGVDVFREDLAVRQSRRQLPQVGFEGLGPLDLSRSRGWRLAGGLLVPLRQRPSSRGTPTPLFVDCQEHPSADRAEAGNQLGQCLGVGEKLVPGKPRQVFFVHPRYEFPDRVETARHATFAGP